MILRRELSLIIQRELFCGAVVGVVFGGNNSRNPTFAQWLQDAGLKVEFGREGLLVTTPIRDEYGNLIVDVVRNHWTVYSEHCLDKNSTREALEVLDRGGHVVLQINLISDIFPTIQIQGEWWDDQHTGRRLVKANDRKGGYVIGLTPSNQHNDQLIEPIFEYPSKYHWRQLRGYPPYSPLTNTWNYLKSMISLEIKYLTNQTV